MGFNSAFKGLILKESTSIVHLLLVFSQIHGMLVKMSSVPSVRIDHRFIPIFYHKQQKRVYWEESGEITE